MTAVAQEMLELADECKAAFHDIDDKAVPRMRIALRKAYDALRQADAQGREALIEQCANVEVRGDVETEAEATNEFQEGYAVGYQDTVYRFRKAIRTLALTPAVAPDAGAGKELQRKALEMRNAIDMIEGALMGFGDLVELPDLFEGQRDDLEMRVPATAGEMRRVCIALSECTRIINSDEFNPDALALTPAVAPGGQKIEMLVSKDWLRHKTETDPDLDTEAGVLKTLTPAVAPDAGAGEITDTMIENCARAMAENAGFAWEACAQSQWRGDARAGLKAALAQAQEPGEDKR